MKKGSFFICTGLLLIAAALLLTARNALDDRRAGRAANAALQQLVPLIDPDPVPAQGRVAAHAAVNGGDAYPADEIEYPDYILDPGRSMPVETVDGREYIGVLELPSLDLTLPVLNEWTMSALRIAPCRYAGSAYLDDMVICAHNYKIHFGSLPRLRCGDAVIFTDIDGNVFSYCVSELVTLQPTAVGEMTEGEWDLTLFTCTPGGSTRFTVRCERTAP